MPVSQEDVDNLSYLKGKVESLIFQYKDKDLVPVYNFYSKTCEKGKEESLNKITRYFYYELKVLDESMENVGPDKLSNEFHSKLEKEAYLQYKEFERIKEKYKLSSSEYPSQDVFWNLAVKNIIGFISYHYENPFEVTK